MNRLICLIMTAMVCLPSICFAHRVIVFAWVEDNRIFVEGGFGSDRPAKRCEIVVFDKKGVVVHKGNTDDHGKYSFAIPDGLDSMLKLVLKAGEGHQADWTLSYDEIFQKSEQQNMQEVTLQKEKISSAPSLLKIIAGVAVIFGLAGLIKLVARKKADDTGKL